MLYRATLFSAFGASSDSPKRATWLKLAALAVLAVLTGHLLADGLSELPGLSNPGTAVLFVFGACTAQLTVLFTLLLGAGPTRILSNDSMTRLLWALPLGTGKRWLALLLPALVLTALALALVAEPLIRLYLLFGLNPTILGVALLVGAISAAGMVYAVPRVYLWARVAVIGGVVLGEALCLRAIAKSYLLGVEQAEWRVWALAAVLAVTVGLFFAGFSLFSNAAAPAQKTTAVKGGLLPPWLWMAKKVMRTSSTRANLALNLVISTAVAWFVAQYPAAAGDRLDMLSFMAAFIAAVTVSDMRGLSRRHNPPEIVSLRDTAYFVRHNYLWPALLALLSVAPLLYPLATAGGAGPEHVGTFMLRTLFGVSAGCLAGMLLTPAPRDITAQFLAAVLCLVYLAGLPQLIPSLQGVSWLSSAMLVAVVLLSLAVGWVLEHRRNAYKWKEKHV